MCDSHPRLLNCKCKAVLTLNASRAPPSRQSFKPSTRSKKHSWHSDSLRNFIKTLPQHLIFPREETKPNLHTRKKERKNISASQIRFTIEWTREEIWSRQRKINEKMEENKNVINENWAHGEWLSSWSQVVLEACSKKGLFNFSKQLSFWAGRCVCQESFYELRSCCQLFLLRKKSFLTIFRMDGAELRMRWTHFRRNEVGSVRWSAVGTGRVKLVSVMRPQI